MRKKIRTIKLLLLIIVIIGSGFGYYYSRYIAPDSYSIKKTTITNNSLQRCLFSHTGWPVPW